MAYTTVNKCTDYFNVVTYSGDGNATQAITNTFETDFSWIKHRGTTAAHTLQDILRGWNKNAKLASNEPHEQNDSGGATWENYGGVSGVSATNFTVEKGSSTPYQTNASGEDYVAWNWKAGGTGSANTDGDINSTVSVNATAGFSIVKWTGNSGSNQSIGHGLGAVPKLILLKHISGAEHWAVYHAGMTASKQMYLNLTNAEETSQFGSSAPTSSLFYVGTNSMVNGSGEDYVAYCFSEVQGYSKFGSYTGNGSTNGPFVYTGFSPAFVIVKRADSTSNWFMYDNKRNTYNSVNRNKLYADANQPDNGEDGGSTTSNICNFLSNGFKMTHSAGSNNDNGNYIYLAFAKESFVSSNEIPATAI